MKYIITILFAFLIIGFGVAQDDEVDPPSEIPELVRQLNVWRLNEGLEVLVYNELLESMATSQAEFLMSLDSLPNDLHAGTQGEDARARSQFEEFAWPTYGHPEVFFVTEIIGIGSIRSAMDYWQNSDLHTRSVTNPVYREIGVAARQRGTDIIFVVVMGAQPNMLPALLDPESDLMYLTTERSGRVGAWIGQSTQYRILDLDLQPLTEWQDWVREVEIPDVSLDSFVVEYEDAEGNRTTYEVTFAPIWSSIASPIEEVEVIVDDTPDNDDPESAEATEEAQAPTFGLPTSTSIPTATPIPTAMPTATTALVTIDIVYDDNTLTIINNSNQSVDLLNLDFGQDEKYFAARYWGQVVNDLNISALQPNRCLQLAGFVTNEGLVFLPGCSFISSYVLISEEEIFWRERSFIVLNGNILKATCEADAGSCRITLP